MDDVAPSVRLAVFDFADRLSYLNDVTNPFVREFAAGLNSRFAEDSERMSMSQWIEKHTHLRKKPFSFVGYEFQRAIADDMSTDLSCIKCSQVGLTEIQLRKYLGFLKRTTAVTGIFTLPDDAMYKRVSATRVKPLVNSEKVFNMGDPQPIRQMGLYQIDQSFAYFTGNKESDATSIPADIKLHDELDLSEQEIISLFSSRLQNSDYKIDQAFSTPTFTGYGIDAKFQVSDQHEYLLRCTSCNHHNIPLFNLDFVTIPGLTADLNSIMDLSDEILDPLDLSQAYLRCERCSEPLDRNTPSLREWVPKFPARKGRGYYVRPFCTSRLEIPYLVDQLLKHKQKDTLRRYYNTVVGEPYNDENARLSEAQIRACMKSSGVPEITPGTPCFLGVDVGNTCHLVLATSSVIFLWKQIKAEDLATEIAALRKQYNIIAGCMDRHPQTVLANSIRDASNNVIMPVEYRGKVAIEFVKDELDNVSHLQGERTGMIDAAWNAIRLQHYAFAGYGYHGPLLVQHFQDMVRIEEPEKPAVWNKVNGNDHFFHAMAFLLMAMRMKKALDYNPDAENRIMYQISNIPILTPNISPLQVLNRKRQLSPLGVH
jgi:hypothetical protein